MKNRILTIIILFLSLFSISCEGREEKVVEPKIRIITTLFPLYDFARNVGGGKVDVTLLLPPGVEPHGFEPTPGDILKINNADIFLYTGKYMEPWAGDILKGIDNKNLLVIDTSKGIAFIKEANTHGHKHAEFDPHIWLDFSNTKKMVDSILEGVVKKDPKNKEFYTKNAEQYRVRIDELDKRFREGLSRCETNIFIHGGHFAFGYLAKRYNLRYLSAYKGFSPDAEPTPKRLGELIKKMKQHNLKHIFYEELITPRVAETIARESGATLLQLHGAHNLTKEEWDKRVSFISLMEQNLKNLKIGLQCQ